MSDNKQPRYGNVTTLGDVVHALAGANFGSGAALTYAISPSKVAIDLSTGRDFVMKMAASSVVKIGNPTNYDDGSEFTLHVQGITSFGTIVWDTLFSTTGSFATFSTGKTKSIHFRYVPGLAKFTECWRTTSK